MGSSHSVPWASLGGLLMQVVIGSVLVCQLERSCVIGGTFGCSSEGVTVSMRWICGGHMCVFS